MSYWIVNTIRYKLKQHGTNHYRIEIKRIPSTQKVITTDGFNPLGNVSPHAFAAMPATTLQKSTGNSTTTQCYPATG